MEQARVDRIKVAAVEPPSSSLTTLVELWANVNELTTQTKGATWRGEAPAREYLDKLMAEVEQAERAMCKFNEELERPVVRDQISSADQYDGQLQRWEQKLGAAFVDAARIGLLPLVQAMLTHRVVKSVDEPNQVHETALLHAASEGRLEMVQFLLSRNASLHSSTAKGKTALHLAAFGGHCDVVRCLVDAGADPQSSKSPGMTPYDAAMAGGHVEVMTFLNPQSTPLCQLRHAAFTGDLETVRKLIREGAPVLEQDHDGYTVLQWACHHGLLEVSRAILEMVDDVTKCQLLGYRGTIPPLALAARKGFLELVQLLLGEHGAQVDVKNIYGSTVLHEAVVGNQCKIVEYLLEKGVKEVDCPNKVGWTPLVTASSWGYNDIVKALLNAGANYNYTDKVGWTPLLAATAGKHVDVMATLLDVGAQVNSIDRQGFTALVVAAILNRLDLAKLLVEKGAVADTTSKFNATPLVFATALHHVKMCKFLIDAGVPVDKPLSGGTTVLHLAAGHGHAELVRLFVRNEANVDAKTVEGFTPAYVAALEGNFDIVDYLSLQHDVIPINDTQKVWTIAELRAFYGRSDGDHPREKSNEPKWVINLSDIAYDEKLQASDTPGVLFGTWLGSVVSICGLKKPEHTRQIRRLISHWYPLNHPHVAKLFGVCVDLNDRVLLVAEPVENGTLRSYLQQHRRDGKTWTLLYQVALALQYLHERGVRHSAVTGGSVWIGRDGVAKLALSALNGVDVPIDWRAPRSVNGSQIVVDWETSSDSAVNLPVESQVYALGMCIIEAVSGDPPYATERKLGLDVEKSIAKGVGPRRPAALGDREWDLVTRMIAPHDRRMSIADSVGELKRLAEKECPDPYPVQPPSGPRASLHEAAADSDEKRLQDRLHDVQQQLSARSAANTSCSPPADYLTSEETWYRSIQWEANAGGIQMDQGLTRLAELVQSFPPAQLTKNCPSTGSWAALRQREAAVHSLHNEIDRVMEILRLDASSSLHNWHTQWDVARRARLKRLPSVLEEIEQMRQRQNDPQSIAFLTCLLFEFTTYQENYEFVDPNVLSRACECMRATPGVRIPRWFVLPDEVTIDNARCLAKGSYGSVHHGKWMNSHVIVKKVFTNNLDIFEREVDMWYQLDHPHVVKLFGACHVDPTLTTKNEEQLRTKRYFVCEHAAGGHLNEYLQSQRRYVWHRLYEAALGLLYLHRRGILHCDLKCNNLLIGRDGRIRVADFGLSSVVVNSNDTASLLNAQQQEGVGAVRWKSPEVLRGEAPSCASDVYSLAMCIVEAVSGAYPWIRQSDDYIVRDDVKRGECQPKPKKGFNDAQWDLVERMSCFNPAQRMPLGEVVEMLKEFAKESDLTSDAVVDDQVASDTSSSPPMTSVSTDSMFESS